MPVCRHAKKTLKNRFLLKFLISTLATVALCLFLVTNSWAWPSDSQWIPLPKGGDPILDDHITGGKDGDTDATGSVNVVPFSGETPAAYIYNDGDYLYYRIRLDSDPTGSGGRGILQSFGWGFEIDTDQNADDYEWLIMCDGISDPEVISLRQNTDKTSLGDPSDKAEFIAAEYPLVGNHRIIMADTCTNDSTNPVNGCGTEVKDDRDYFLDFQIPYAVFLAATGIDDNTLIRYFVGSSNSTNNLTENGADLLAGSNLYDMGSDFITPLGTLPPDLTFYDGTIRFVEDLGGFGDVIMATVGDTLYLRVDDLDLSNETNPGGTIRVELESTQTGDIEVLILTATGVQGKYSGSISTSATDSDGVLAVTTEDTVIVTYIDAVAADLSQSVPRTDTLTISAVNTDLGIIKTVNDLVPNQFDTITYTITITNQGPNHVDGVIVTDTLAALAPDLAYNTSTLTQGLFNSVSGVWTVGTLLYDPVTPQTATLTIAVDVTVQDDTSTAFINTAAITNAYQYGSTTIPNVDANAANDQDSATINVQGTDLLVTKTVDNSQPTEKDEITYLLRVLNLGPNKASNIKILEDLPDEVTYNSATGNGTFSGTTWDVGDLDSGAGALIQITVNVNDNTSGTSFTNTASVLEVDQPDPNSDNDSDSVIVDVDFIDLKVNKTVSDRTPDPGDQITYSITLTNDGPHQATNVTIFDQLPTGVTYVSDDSGGNYDTTTHLWTIGTISNGGSATLIITVEVDAGTAGQTIENYATIDTVDQTDRNPINDLEEATATVKVSGTDIEIFKEVDILTPGEGDTVTYTLKVINNGPNSGTGIQVTDILPGSNVPQIDGVTYTGATPSQGTYDGKNTSWIWDVGSLGLTPLTNSATLTITATVEKNTAGLDVINTAMITAADQADPNGGNNAASALIAVDGTDLGVTKTVDDPYPDIGDYANYTITLSNYGPSDASNVFVTDLLPPELVYNTATPSQGSYSDITGLWDVGTLTYNSTATLGLNVEIRNEDKSLIITNNTSITAMDQGDPNSSNDFDSADIYIAASNLAVSKTVDFATPFEGQTITYNVVITNEGDNATTEIQIDDVLPVGITEISHTVSRGAYGGGLWWIDVLPAKSSATLTILATVDSGTAGSTITNTAEIVALGEIDPDPSDDIASVDINPQTRPPLPLLTIMKSANESSAAPGGVLIYTVTVLNSGSAGAYQVSLDDDLSEYTAWGVDSYDTGQPFDEPFLLTQLEPDPGIGADSGVTLGTPIFYDPSDTIITPNADPEGFDANVKRWVLPMPGIMVSGGKFRIQYQVKVK